MNKCNEKRLLSKRDIKNTTNKTCQNYSICSKKLSYVKARRPFITKRHINNANYFKNKDFNSEYETMNSSLTHENHKFGLKNGFNDIFLANSLIMIFCFIFLILIVLKRF